MLDGFYCLVGCYPRSSQLMITMTVLPMQTAGRGPLLHVVRYQLSTVVVIVVRVIVWTSVVHITFVIDIVVVVIIVDVRHVVVIVR